MKERYLTIEEVAELLRVSERTVYRWIRNGNLQAIQVMEGGGYRIPQSEIDRFYGTNQA
jgi:excisionase family DNA binding protein